MNNGGRPEKTRRYIINYTETFKDGRQETKELIFDGTFDAADLKLARIRRRNNSSIFIKTIEFARKREGK